MKQIKSQLEDLKKRAIATANEINAVDFVKDRCGKHCLSLLALANVYKERAEGFTKQIDELYLLSVATLLKVTVNGISDTDNEVLELIEEIQDIQKKTSDKAEKISSFIHECTEKMHS